jgi:hypothetical protein
LESTTSLAQQLPSFTKKNSEFTGWFVHAAKTNTLFWTSGCKEASQKLSKSAPEFLNEKQEK